MSTRNIFLISLLTALLSGLAAGACVVFLAVNTDIFEGSDEAKDGAGAGYRLLTEFQCRYGETKHILMNGVDDNFALGNAEPAGVSPRLAHLPGHPANNPSTRDYDETGQDKNLVDYFNVPAKVTRGLFVTRIKSMDDYGSDYISLGDFSTFGGNYGYSNFKTFGSWLNDFPTRAGWAHTSTGLFSAELKDIVFRFNDPDKYEAKHTYAGLLPYLQSQENASVGEGVVIDVMVSDDTAVDFTGLALCTEPEFAMGVTLVEFPPLRDRAKEYLMLTCDSSIFAYPCNPIYGDTVCSHALPVACFKDGNLPVPELDKSLPFMLREDTNQHWTAGYTEFAPVRRGDEFETVDEVNKFCEAEFGAGWRVMTYHQGGLKNVVGPAPKNIPGTRVWIDIQDQPKATCWGRGGDKQEASAP